MRLGQSNVERVERHFDRESHKKAQSDKALLAHFESSVEQYKKICAPSN